MSIFFSKYNHLIQHHAVSMKVSSHLAKMVATFSFYTYNLTLYYKLSRAIKSSEIGLINLILFCPEITLTLKLMNISLVFAKNIFLNLFIFTLQHFESYMLYKDFEHQIMGKLGIGHVRPLEGVYWKMQVKISNATNFGHTWANS
jgi:hypothetical protein